MRLSLAISLTLVIAAPAAAQQRPFIFSVVTAPDSKPAVRVDYDLGLGERAFQSGSSNQPEQRVGVQASRGRLTLLARVGIVETGSSYQSSQSGEALYSVLRPERGPALAVGGGVLHEADGVNVLLARVATGHTGERWRLQGNLLFQKPMSEERDAVDLITSVGWTRKVGRSVSFGVEVLGEDLEGFWESEEAEGGARLLAGPSLHIAPADGRWQVVATGGPMFHPADSGRASGALRDLPPDPHRVSYAIKASFSIGLTSMR